jgi:hypothetical protein
MPSKKYLDPGETLIRRARIHWLLNLRGFFLPNLTATILVTDRRILYCTGLIAIRTRSVALSQIESRDVTQSISGRLLSYGDLALHGSGGMELHLTGIADPAGVSRDIGQAALTKGQTKSTIAVQI